MLRLWQFGRWFQVDENANHSHLLSSIDNLEQLQGIQIIRLGVEVPHHKICGLFHLISGQINRPVSTDTHLRRPTEMIHMVHSVVSYRIAVKINQLGRRQPWLRPHYHCALLFLLINTSGLAYNYNKWFRLVTNLMYSSCIIFSPILPKLDQIKPDLIQLEFPPF